MLGNLAMLFWYSYDDRLASFVGIPEIGQLPTIVWFVLGAVSVGSEFLSGIIQELFNTVRNKMR